MIMDGYEAKPHCPVSVPQTMLSWIYDEHREFEYNSESERFEKSLRFGENGFGRITSLKF